MSRLQIHRTVQRALRQNRPVLALESTILAHGLPYPQNWELCQELQHPDVVTATIAMKNGIAKVGLEWDELKELTQTKRAIKCSTRELSLFAAQHQENEMDETYWGATTVASTMHLAHQAGIATFVTGGIGGVHRDGHNSMDVSADLLELGRTPVVVVSAGIKSILDIPRTLEVLETNGVPTVSYQTDQFPAFFSPDSGVSSPATVQSADEVADAYWASRELGLSHGMLVAVPNYDPAGANVEAAIQEALREASDQGIHGQGVTPYILRRVNELTGGDSLRSNIALVKNNLRVGAEIAKAIAERRRSEDQFAVPESYGFPKAKVAVLGGIVLDIVARPTHPLVLKTSNPSRCTESDGGVGRNVAEVLGRLGSPTLLFSAVGNDSRGRALVDRLTSACGIGGADQSVSMVDDASTATYLALLDDQGDLHAACADMEVLSEIAPIPIKVLEDVKIVVMDTNPPLEVLRETARRAEDAGVTVVLEPTSVPKTKKLDDDLLSRIHIATPNLDELVALGDAISVDGKDLESVKELALTVLDRLSPAGAHLTITMGENGVLLASKVEGSVTFQHFPASKDVPVRNATGAGDSFCGALVHALLQDQSMENAVRWGMQAAEQSLRCADRAIASDVRVG